VRFKQILYIASFWVILTAGVGTLLVSKPKTAVTSPNLQPVNQDTLQDTLPVKPDGYEWELAFSDEFESNELNKDRWSTCYDWFSEEFGGCSNNGNNELQWYRDSQARVDNGFLELKAEKEDSAALINGEQKYYYYKSGMVSSGRTTTNSEVKFQAKYGYYEARIKVPLGTGLWPAFWLLPTNQKWPPEIDVMEVLGDKPESVLMTYYWPDANGLPQKDNSQYIRNTSADQWHTYAVNWQPGTIDWYIDGQMRKSVTSDKVPDTEMQIILNLAVGGNLPGWPDEKTVFPATMYVDYMRYYALKQQ
jgi:beta-glucanase (GH16 family)